MEVLIDGERYLPESSIHISQKQEAAYGLCGHGPFFSSIESREFLVAHVKGVQLLADTRLALIREAHDALFKGDHDRARLMLEDFLHN